MLFPFMRAVTVSAPGEVAVMAKKSKSSLRESILSEPTINVLSHQCPVLSSVTLNMIDGKELFSFLSATFALTSVGSQDIFSELIPPAFGYRICKLTILYPPLLHAGQVIAAAFLVVAAGYLVVVLFRLSIVNLLVGSSGLGICVGHSSIVSPSLVSLSILTTSV